MAPGVPGLVRFVQAAAAVLPFTSPAVPRTENARSNLIVLPLVLLLGCDEDLEARCRSIATHARVLVRSVPVPFTRSEVAALRPLVIVVPEHVYEGAPWGYEVLAEKVGASLLMLDSKPIASIVLEYRVMEALTFATRMRDRMNVVRAGKRT